MKKQVAYILFLFVLVSFAGCKKYLDINSDPDTPQFPDPSSVFPTQLAAIPYGLQRDARYVSRWIQNFAYNDVASTANIGWDQMGYIGASDANGDIWRQTYFGLGQNLNYIIDNGIRNKQWDYVGASIALKALLFQYATDYHGEIIFTEAFRENQAFFKFDSQELVYKGVDSLCRLAISYLQKRDRDTTRSNLSKGDYVYGQTASWIKFTYGILARNWHHLTNKASYNADSVIAFCDKSLAATGDDFLVPFDAQKNEDANFFGTYRNNLTFFRQTNFIVKLLDGTTLSGSNAFSNRDPRIRHMLAASGDTATGNGGYRGLDPGLGDPLFTFTTGVNANKRVAAPWGDSIYNNPAASNFSANFKKYLFGDKVVFPVMTASEIQFIKAEAAFLKEDKSLALLAYTRGINLHIDFINRPFFPRSNGLLYNQNPISAAERTSYLAGPNVRRSADSLTLSDIMLQKYIALWGWGFFETWVDMRRYHYTDIDPATRLQVYLGFSLPATLSAANLGKPVYRVRPRYNSEYGWNAEELQRIGGFNSDYHTYETWFSKP
ncbi:MAG: SusD/RagB family nutrient-binding outer membrane lipoprotein [Chitinophagaceae bacterium]